jgi:hypothetical protein
MGGPILIDNVGTMWQVGVVSGKTSSAAAIPPGSQTVTPASMAPGGFKIGEGSTLLIDYATARFEAVTVVQPVTATTFTAVFLVNHSVTPVSIIVGGFISTTEM